MDGRNSRPDMSELSGSGDIRIGDLSIFSRMSYRRLDFFNVFDLVPWDVVGYNGWGMMGCIGGQFTYLS